MSKDESEDKDMYDRYLEDGMRKYDVAAYIWPAYTGTEPRTSMFWPEGMGEWQSVKNAKKKFEGHSWPRKPLWGYVDEANSDIMEMEINTALDYGVNVFIYDWYWFDGKPFLEKCLTEGFLKAKNRNKMKFYLMWANHDANNLWDIRLSDRPENVIWKGAVDRQEFENIARRVIINFFSQPNYYTIDGEPVFMIYDTNNLLKGLGGEKEVADALEWFRQETIKAGFPGLHLQQVVYACTKQSVTGLREETKKDGEQSVKLGFNSITHYQFVHYINMDREYREILKEVRKEWDELEQTYRIPYYPHISVGWDNNPRFSSFRPEIMKGNTPEAFEKGLQMAKEYLEHHPQQVPLVTINSWNEWTETSYLEPDDYYGYGYLQAIKRVFLEE